MTIIKKESAKGANMIERANNNEGFYLWDVYGSVSSAKNRAWEYCRECYYKENGSNFRIISHNTFQFSVAWETSEGLRIETANNSYLIH